jgi:hypothetical protein
MISGRCRSASAQFCRPASGRKMRIGEASCRSGSWLGRFINQSRPGRSPGSHAASIHWVLPKYRNPQTSETWSGRGKRPRSLVAAMKSGRRIEEFRVDQGTSKGWRGVILPSANINPLDSEAPLGSTRSVSAHVRQSNLDEAAMRGINPNGMCQAAASPHGFRSPWKVTP